MLEQLKDILRKMDEGIGDNDWHEIKSAFNDLEIVIEQVEDIAAQQPLAVDVAEVCDCGEPFPESGYCKFCGAHQRHRQ